MQRARQPPDPMGFDFLQPGGQLGPGFFGSLGALEVRRRDQFGARQIAAEFGALGFKLSGVAPVFLQLRAGRLQSRPHALRRLLGGGHGLAGETFGGGGALLGGGGFQRGGSAAVLGGPKLAVEFIGSRQLHIEQLLQLGGGGFGVFQRGVAGREQIVQFENLGLGFQQPGLRAAEFLLPAVKISPPLPETGLKFLDAGVELDQLVGGSACRTHGGGGGDTARCRGEVKPIVWLRDSAVRGASIAR